MSLISATEPKERTANVVAGIPELVATMRGHFDSGRTRPQRWRQRQLEGLARLLEEREAEILDALAADLGKPKLEAFTAEVAYLASEIAVTRKKLAKWMKPTRVRTPLVTQPGKSFVHKDPLGLVLIIAPWNYPFQLALAPLVGALAAGNCAVVKPSEISPQTSTLIARLLPEYLDPDCVKVVEGAVPETTELLAQRWDHIFYTGNGTVGRIVMAAAAKHLTPVTLELGGKSPCIVDEQVNLDVAARRIVWGKFYNAGQTCVAPDYVLAHESVHDLLLDKLVSTVREFYGADPQKSGDYGRIVNERHHRRLMKLMDSGEAVVGGTGDESDRYIAPTVLRNVAGDSPVMADEIFGPILPVLPIESVDKAIAFVNERPKPLALYLFSDDGEVQKDVIRRTSSGGATINHAWLHLAVHDLPFGGVGESGMGAYHGKASFDTFTHHKSVLQKPTKVDPTLLYPPYDDKKKKILRFLM